MKAIVNPSMKYLLVLPALIVSPMVGGVACLAQEQVGGTPNNDEVIEGQILGAPQAREATAEQLARDVFGQSIEPVERVKGDHVAAGISLRNRGGGVINLRGAPENSQAVKAYLYWDLLADRSNQSMTVSVNGVSVQGALIGQGDSPCWPPAYNFAYRALIPLHLLYQGINGDYKIAGIPNGEGFGMSPFEATTPPLAEGATLVVFYKAASTPFSLTYIYEAPLSGQMFGSLPGETLSVNLTGFVAPSSKAKFTLVGADGQVGSGLTSFYNTTAETSFFQGTQIAGPPNGGTSLSADSDWNGQDVQPLNQLWDTRTHIIPIKVDSTSAEVKYTAPLDCLVTVAFFLGL